LKVLCIYQAEGVPRYRGNPQFRAPLRRWQDAKMVEVSSLSDLAAAFEHAMQLESSSWTPSRVVPTKPTAWKLLSYVPEGKADQAVLLAWG
jgi:hypothetical protein